MPFALEFKPFPADGGAVSYALVPWDTELYGLPCYELRCAGPADRVSQALPEWLKAIYARTIGQPSFAFTRIQSSNVALCEAVCRHGFYPAELTLTISLPLRRFTRTHANVVRRAQLRAATAADLPHVSALAGGAFWADRFHLDPHLPQHLSDRRYAQWVERGYHDGDSLFVYEQSGDVAQDRKIVGFYLIRGTPGGEVELSLAGVDARYRRTGIGALMYEDMLDVCRELGYRMALTDVSANNLDVVNLFLGLGFGIRSAHLTMHLFLNPTVASDG